MASTKLSNIAGGGGSLPRLAQDLTYPSDKDAAAGTIKRIVVPVVAGVKTTTLSLTGEWKINFIEYDSLIAEAMTHKLTIDGGVIWNSVGQSGTTERLLGSQIDIQEAIKCSESLLLEITTTTDTSVRLNFLARPIL